MDNAIIQILITPKEFEHYNERPPKNDMELKIYAQEVLRFIKEGIDAQDNKMVNAIWMNEEQ